MLDGRSVAEELIAADHGRHHEGGRRESWPLLQRKGGTGMRERSEFISFLEQQVHAYTEQLEGMFGECDKRFVFGTINKSTGDAPHTEYPGGHHYNGDCIVDIHISKWLWDSRKRDQRTWQVAHECVHLLDPGQKGSANFLEEGLATWFQDEPRFHDDLVNAFVKAEIAKGGIKRSKDYAEAKELVCGCLPQLIPAVKKIRSSGVKIWEITEDMLAPPCLPNGR